jgi:hypothetical protein
VNHHRKIGSIQGASESVKAGRMVEMPMTENDRFDVFGRNVQCIHIGNQAIWRCTRVKEEMWVYSPTVSVNQCAEAMLRKRTLIGSPALRQLGGDAQFLGTQACALRTPRSRSNASKKLSARIVKVTDETG